MPGSTLAWTGQEESSPVSRNKAPSSDSDKPTISSVILIIAWKSLKSEGASMCTSAPCSAGSTPEDDLHVDGVPAPGEHGWTPGLEEVWSQIGKHSRPWEQ